jgi:hypothetical protein
MGVRQRRRKLPIGGTRDAERHGGGGETGRRGARPAALQLNEVRRRGRGREIGESGRMRLIRPRQRAVAPKRKLRRNKPLNGQGQSAADRTMSRTQGRGPPRADGVAMARVASTDRLRQMRYPRRSSWPFGLVASRLCGGYSRIAFVSASYTGRIASPVKTTMSLDARGHTRKAVREKARMLAPRCRGYCNT